MRCVGPLLIVALLRAAPAAGQLPGIAGYDLADLDAIAARRNIELRAALARATALDTGVLRAVLGLADPADSAVLAQSRGFPALLWSLLLIYGDRDFASQAGQLPAEARRLVIAALDRGSGTVLSGPFPTTWALGTHDSTLLGARAGHDAADSVVDTLRVYGPAGLHRMPGVLPSSCLPLAYPPDLLRQGISGNAVIEIVLDSAGTALPPGFRVVSATHAGFGDAAERFVRSCHFSPGRRAGRAVRSTFRLMVPFVPDSVDVQTGPGTFQQLQSGSVERAVQRLGIPYTSTLMRAGRGDTAALRSILAIAEFLPAGHPASPDYAQALETMLLGYGDHAFAAMVTSLAQPVRERIGALLDFQAEDVPAHRATSAAVAHPAPPPFRATAVADTAPAVIEDLVEQPPRLRIGTCREPELPGDLRRLRLRARVDLEFIIDTTGRVEHNSLRVLSTPNLGVSRPARDAAESCRYRPGRMEGVAVRVKVQRPIEFAYMPRGALRVR